MLLDIEGKKANVSLSATEVLALPKTTGSGFTIDSLMKNLTDAGWAVSVVPGDKKHAWPLKENRRLLMYFSMNATDTGLYFAKASSAPQPNTHSAVIVANQTSTTTKQPTQQTAAITNSGFVFTTTNFDDGWNSTAKEDWVEVTKGNLKVVLHYPNKAAEEYNSDLITGLKKAWDVLVAPRYSSASNMDFRSLYSYESIEFAQADMVEITTGKTVYVVLFKKNFSSGKGKYIEFISP